MNPCWDEGVGGKRYRIRFGVSINTRNFYAHIQECELSLASSIGAPIISTCTPWLPSCDTAAPQITTRCPSPSTLWLSLTTSTLVEPQAWTYRGCRCCELGGRSRGGRIFNKGCVGGHESLIAKLGTGNLNCRLAMLLILFRAFEGIRHGSLA